MKSVSDKLVYLLLLLLLPGALYAQESRLALVIGNSEYRESPLTNPKNDANDMAAVLQDLGFKVILRTDADRRSMGRAIRDFGRELKESQGVGLFYYAGHGLQIENRNYLIPVGTPLEEEDEVPYESIDVGSVLAKMESAGNSLNLIILDACRNNPFPQSFRSTTRGLARVEAPIGSLVVYSTAPGAVASDGEGRNGVFTGALLDQLRTEGLSLTQTIRRTRAAVVEATNGQQVPWESSSLLQDYYFSAPAEGSPAEPQSTVRKAKSAEFESATSPPPKPAATASTPSHSDSETLAMLDDSERTLPQAPKAKSTDADTTAITEAKPSETKQQDLKQTGLSALTISVDPPDARIRIMDIVEKYKPGITLDTSRSYDVLVSHSGYDSYRETLFLEDEATALNINLTKKGANEPELVAIDGGTFTMGCSTGDKRCEDYEKPVRSISIKPFYISATEITVGQFDEFVANTDYTTDAENNSGGNSGCFTWSDSGGISRSEARWGWDKTKNWRNPGYRQTPAHPVTCVSWNDATRYAQWLKKRTGKDYSLPSESEWELAARAASQGQFGRVDTARGLCAIGNVADNTASPSGSKWANRINCTDYHWFSAPVASFQANGFGLYDMQGNAWEWVADEWSDSLSSVPADGSPNTTAAANKARVLKGGGWDSDASRVRLSSRSKGSASGRASMTGFRLVIRNNTD